MKSVDFIWIKHYTYNKLNHPKCHPTEYTYLIYSNISNKPSHHFEQPYHSNILHHICNKEFQNDFLSFICLTFFTSSKAFILHLETSGVLDAIVYPFIMAQNRLLLARFWACFTRNSKQSRTFCVTLNHLLAAGSHAKLMVHQSCTHLFY
jgi:hypothetical protein